MGQAKLKKLQIDRAQEIARGLDKHKFAQAVRLVVASCTDFHGADCLLYAVIGAGALRELGIPADVVAGSATWRVGPGDSDVISHAREVTGELYIQAGVPQALQFHSWIEAPGQIIDLTTHTLALKAAQLDEADGGSTQVNWRPDFLWIDHSDQQGRQKTPGQVVQAPDAGQFCYIRHADIEDKVLPMTREIARESASAIAATLSAYESLVNGTPVRVMSFDERGEIQETPEHQSLVRFTQRD